MYNRAVGILLCDHAVELAHKHLEAEQLQELLVLLLRRGRRLDKLRTEKKKINDKGIMPLNS